MDTCQYVHVPTREDLIEEKSWKPFFRQLLVSWGVLTIYFSIGICFGAPTIIIQQMRTKANSTDAVSLNMASWLSSVFGYASLPWIFILTAISHIYGRRKAFLLVSFNTITMFVCFYSSVTISHIIITSIIQGMTHAASLTISIIITAEFTSPEYRGVFLTLKTASVFWGVWFSNAIGTFSHWKYIPLFGLFCSCFSLTAFIWPESPYWLASKGKFEECKISHRWLKGRGLKAERELEKLLSAPVEMFKLGTIQQIRSKEFCKPILIACLMTSQFYASGKFVCSVYSIEILKKMTSNVNAAYSGMLILDGVTVFSMYVGCMLTRVLKRRFQLFSTSSIGIIFLFTLSLYMYLIKLEVIIENNILTVAILMAYSIAIGCGPGIIAPSTFAELIPTKFKNLCTIIVSVWFQALNSTLLKTFPYVYISFGLHGTFLCFGVSMLILTIILYKMLPETKDKTLLEIEEYFK